MTSSPEDQNIEPATIALLSYLPINLYGYGNIVLSIESVTPTLLSCSVMKFLSYLSNL